jgi:uncharacterized membrane protein
VTSRMGELAPEARGRRAGRLGLALLLGGAAVGHVVQSRAFEAMVPTWVPGSPRFWNLTSGAAEAGAAALLVRRRTSRLGGAVAFGTLLAVYPANVQAALDDGTPGLPGWAGSRQAAVLRLPLQLPPLVAAWRVWRTG